MLTPRHFLVPWSWKSRATPLLPLWAVQPVLSLSACTRVTFTFGHERVELYLYSPYGPYGLYWASVPIQGWPLPLVMKEYSYTSTPPMGRTVCTEPQCLYKGDLYLWSWKSTAIPLLPLCAVQPVQSLSACTRVHFTFTFGHERVELYLYSPYGPYSLYKGDLYLFRKGIRTYKSKHKVILTSVLFFTCLLKPYCSCYLSRMNIPTHTLTTQSQTSITSTKGWKQRIGTFCLLIACCARTVRPDPIWTHVPLRNFCFLTMISIDSCVSAGLTLSPTLHTAWGPE
jgi:hypothetical protein